MVSFHKRCVGIGRWLWIRVSPRDWYSNQSWVSTVKLIKKAVAVNLHTEGAVTFP